MVLGLAMFLASVVEESGQGLVGVSAPLPFLGSQVGRLDRQEVTGFWGCTHPGAVVHSHLGSQVDLAGAANGARGHKWPPCVPWASQGVRARL